MGASNAENNRRELPTKSALGEAGEIKIQDKDGKEIALKSLYTEKPANERQLLIFIRHFFCGYCEQYIQALTRDLPPSLLSPANITITIIGNGGHVLIADYAKRTSCPFDIYTDPSMQIHKSLGMMSTLKPAPSQPAYAPKSLMKIVMSSLWTGLTSGHPLSAGSGAQNGGEFLFQDGELKWCSRMRNTTDHTETKELKEVLGLQE